DDHDRLRIPSTSPSHQSEAEKKESMARRLNRRCPPSDTPSSLSSFDHVLSAVRHAEPGSTQNREFKKSAKVVLVAVAKIAPRIHALPKIKHRREGTSRTSVTEVVIRIRKPARTERGRMVDMPAATR